MTRNERIDAERAIQKYNDKKWTGSVGAVLLHRAASVIKHYKDENTELKSSILGFAEERAIFFNYVVGDTEDMSEIVEVHYLEFAMSIRKLKAENAELKKELELRYFCFDRCTTCKDIRECTNH